VVVTLSGSPLGLGEEARGSPVAGSFTYDLAVPDARPSDPMRGEFDHAAGGGPFELSVGGRTVTGSGRPVVSLELYGDTFRWVDGAELLEARVASVDGAEDRSLSLSLQLNPLGFDAFATDALPPELPFAGRAPGEDFLMTFEVSDAAGTLLVELESLGANR
jgi:hypothetical protein